jgi:hypothetical protein
MGDNDRLLRPIRQNLLYSHLLYNGTHNPAIIILFVFTSFTPSPPLLQKPCATYIVHYQTSSIRITHNNNNNNNNRHGARREDTTSDDACSSLQEETFKYLLPTQATLIQDGLLSIDTVYR